MLEFVNSPYLAPNPNLRSRMLRVAAGVSLELEDVVAATLGAPDSSGALLLASHAELVITSRTATHAGAGSVGQGVTGVPAERALGIGEQALLSMLDRGASTHTNIGLTSIAPVPTDVDIQLHASAGELIAATTVTLPPHSSQHLSDVFADVGEYSGYAVVSSSTEGAAYSAHASVVDTTSGDAVFVLGQGR